MATRLTSRAPTPTAFPRAMSAAYAEYLKKYGVIEVPGDYDMTAHAKKNAKLSSLSDQSL